ncbi:MAG TPA: ABC transporter permease [Reyranella sp.]|jgi:peptide/nickel transport system permease protein|nr:ABC transporter permease [Reyranella sp.]
MARYAVRQLGYMALTLLVVSCAVFVLNEFAPGDVARKLLGAYATQEQVEHLTQQLGLDRPVLVRYLEYMGDVLRGNFGQSLTFKVPVAQILLERLSNTLLLAAIAFAVIVPLAVLFGVLAGMREGSVQDHSILIAANFLSSLPEFATGVFLVSIFTVWLGWLPGTSPLSSGGNWSIASQLVMPVLVMALYDMGYLIAMIRVSMIGVMRQPFIRTAILKGMKRRDVIVKHALRNALIAPFTAILLQINYLIAGVVVVETVFAYPGFGRLMLQAAMSKDIALVEAGALVAVLIAMTTQLVGDLGYMLLDPRIRIQK